MATDDTDQYLRLAKDMLSNSRYSFASDFLESVIEQGENKGSLTTKQKRAIQNIFNKG